MSSGLLPDMRVALVMPLLLLSPSSAGAAETGVSSYPPGIELPAGEGRNLLLAACTRCHDLRGLPAYKGYWNQERWHFMVDTMVKNGAPLDAGQMEVLAAYLAEYFGVPGKR
jgi:hypothetical protein